MYRPFLQLIKLPQHFERGKDRAAGNLSFSLAEILHCRGEEKVGIFRGERILKSARLRNVSFEMRMWQRASKAEHKCPMNQSVPALAVARTFQDAFFRGREKSGNFTRGIVQWGIEGKKKTGSDQTGNERFLESKSEVRVVHVVKITF